jgi:transglutaminase-like putative cysteine protease
MNYLPFVMILFVSCSNFMAPDFTYTTETPEAVTDLESAFLYASMPYTLDSDTHGTEEYWQGPGETMDRGTGDCEDFAILFSALAEELGHDAKVVFCYGHCVSRVDGKYYDPTPILTDDGWKADAFEPVEVEDIERVYTVSEAIQIAVEEYGSY